MNINPWFLECIAEYESDRIRPGMNQIRLEEEMMRAGRTDEKTAKARLYGSCWLMLIVYALVKLSPLRLHMRKTLRLSGSTWPCRG